jgi:putative peptide zinc metalloprotease protein
MIANREQAIYPPMPTRVSEVLVAPGQFVQEGEVLVRLASPELELRARNARVNLATAKAEYVRGVATSNRQERTRVFAEQVNEALAELHSVEDEYGRLELRAAGAGVIRDMKSELVVGRWVNPRELLLRVVGKGTAHIEAYVSDGQIGSLEVGQAVKFIPDVPGASTLKGEIIAIDKTGVKQLQRPLLAAPYGGSLESVIDKKGQVVARGAAYRVLIEPRGETVGAVNFVTRGTVRIHTDLGVVAENFVYRLLSLIVRESGI